VSFYYRHRSGKVGPADELPISVDQRKLVFRPAKYFSCFWPRTLLTSILC
jgi:hypothetical protein